MKTNLSSTSHKCLIKLMSSEHGDSHTIVQKFPECFPNQLWVPDETIIYPVVVWVHWVNEWGQMITKWLIRPLHTLPVLEDPIRDVSSPGEVRCPVSWTTGVQWWYYIPWMLKLPAGYAFSTSCIEYWCDWSLCGLSVSADSSRYLPLIPVIRDMW